MLEVRLWASQRAQRLEHKTSFARCIISMLVIASGGDGGGGGGGGPCKPL